MKRLIPLAFAAISAFAGAAEGDNPPRGPGPAHGSGHSDGQGHGQGPGQGRGPMLRGVELTEAQEDKLFAIVHALEPQRRQHERDARKAHEALRTLADSGQFDESKAAALAQAEGRAVSALALQRARADAQILAILTAEQRKQQAGRHDRRELHEPREAHD